MTLKTGVMMLKIQLLVNYIIKYTEYICIYILNCNGGSRGLMVRELDL